MIEEEIPNKLKITRNNFSNSMSNKNANSNKRTFTPQKKDIKKNSGINSSSSKGVFNLSTSQNNVNKVTNARTFGVSSSKNRENLNIKKSKLSDKNLVVTSINGTTLNNFKDSFKKKK